MKALLIFGACFIASTVSLWPDCIIEKGEQIWGLYEDDRRCIKAFDTPLPYKAAQNFCRGYGGRLAAIRNYRDNYYFANIVKLFSKSPARTWIGLSLNTVWDDESPMNYTNWKKGYSPAGVLSDCVYYELSTNTWVANKDCETAYPFMCQVYAFQHGNAWTNEQIVLSADNEAAVVRTDGVDDERTVDTQRHRIFVRLEKGYTVPTWVTIKMRYYTSAASSITFKYTTPAMKFQNSNTWENLTFNVTLAYNSFYVEVEAARAAPVAYKIAFCHQAKNYCFDDIYFYRQYWHI